MRKQIGFIFLIAAGAAMANGVSSGPVRSKRVDLPLVFEPNRGQAERKAQWLARGRGYNLHLSDSGADMILTNEQAHAVRMELAGSRAWRQGHGREPTGGISNYYLGNKPSEWRTGVPHFRRVEYEGVYEGIDLVFYGNQGSLEYDLVVRPGADPDLIRLSYQGVRGVEVDPTDGDLVLITDSGAQVRQHRPRVYQEIEGRKVEVAGVYEILDRRRVRVQLAFYDRSRPLVIDPVIVYSTYLAGGGLDGAEWIAVDASGSAYVTGYTASINFPTKNPLQTDQPDKDAFVTMLTPAGNDVVYSTYIGGSKRDEAQSIAVDGAGSAYITGFTYSTNFPTLTPYQADKPDVDAFLVKIAPSGAAMVYSTYLGGNKKDFGESIAVDAAGSAYVVGSTLSTNFPTKSQFQTDKGLNDAFLTRFTPGGNDIVFSTYIGGSKVDEALAVAVDRTGSAYVTGITSSPDFPTKNPYQAAFKTPASTACEYCSDAFIAKFTPAGDQLAYSTYFGGTGDDYAQGIAVDAAGSAYFAGFTGSPDLPTRTPYQLYRGLWDGFLAKLSPAGNSLVYSTYIGGAADDRIEAVTVDGSGSAYVTGGAASTDFPTKSPIMTDKKAGDAFVTRFTPTGNDILFSTYLGGKDDDGARGIVLDSAGAVYVSGGTMSTDFPTVGPYQKDKATRDAFVVKLTVE